MADSPKAHSAVDALAALAAGTHETAAENSPAPEASSETPSAASVALAEPGEALSAPAAPASRQVLKARMNAQMAKSQAAQFKRALIPMCLAMGLMLFIAGGVTLYILADAPADGAQDSPMMKYAALSSFPLGVMLLAGAWLFHREIKRT